MTGLVENLLQYAPLDQGEIPAEPVKLDDVVHQALGYLEADIEVCHANVSIGKLPQVWGNPLQLAQVFQNLIGNAIKFRGEAAPLVRVWCEEGPEGYQIAVSDNGIGIDRQHLGTVFGVFKRLHSASRYPGSGVGLAIVRKIVERHGGSISLQSAPGEGTTFTLSLPRTSMPPIVLPAEGVEPSPTPGVPEAPTTPAKALYAVLHRVVLEKESSGFYPEL